MHFSRSLAGVALLGVFAAMAFAGAATGAPAQSEQSTATQVASLTGEKLQLQKRGEGPCRLWPARRRRRIRTRL